MFAAVLLNPRDVFQYVTMCWSRMLTLMNVYKIKLFQLARTI